MRFWDSSAIVPLLVREPRTTAAAEHYERDPDVATWWLTEVECVSALARLEREGHLEAAVVGTATARLAKLKGAWVEVQPSSSVKRVSIRLLRVHPLRAADALQLAAALVAAEDHPETLPLVTLDDRLAAAATREGFEVVQPEPR